MRHARQRGRTTAEARFLLGSRGYVCLEDLHAQRLPQPRRFLDALEERGECMPLRPLWSVWVVAELREDLEGILKRSADNRLRLDRSDFRMVPGPHDGPTFLAAYRRLDRYGYVGFEDLDPLGQRRRAFESLERRGVCRQVTARLGEPWSLWALPEVQKEIVAAADAFARRREQHAHHAQHARPWLAPMYGPTAAGLRRSAPPPASTAESAA